MSVECPFCNMEFFGEESLTQHYGEGYTECGKKYLRAIEWFLKMIGDFTRGGNS